MAGCLGKQVSPSCPTGGGGEDAQAPKGSERAGWDVKTEQTQIQIQTQMQILPVTWGQTSGMSLTLMTVLTLTGQVMVFLRMTNVCISSGRRQPGVSGAWYMSSTTSCFSQETSWGLVHVFNNKLFFTRDIMDDDTVRKHFSVPEPKPKSGSKGQHRQEFRMLYHRKKGFGPQPVAYFYFFWRKSLFFVFWA